MLAVNPNPREYDNARFVRYSTTSWVPPAPSARINTLAPDPARGGKRQLCQRFGDDADVVGGGVTAGVARTQRQGQRFPGACLAVVDERAERMMPEASLVGRGCVFFLQLAQVHAKVCKVRPSVPGFVRMGWRLDVGVGRG